jgi:hypothetical protein
MHIGDSIEYLAKAEGRRIRPIKDESELDELDADLGRKIPAFRIKRSDVRTGPAFVAEFLNRDPGHDNVGRIPFLADFLNRRVLPMVDSAVDVTGIYRIELHDSYSYLPGRHLYKNVLSFGRTKDAHEQSVALMADPYHMGDFGGIVHTMSLDNVPWDRKVPKLFFAGTTTGNKTPQLNERIKACIWSLDRRDVADMYITKVAQIDFDKIHTAFPRFSEALHLPVSPMEHFPYKYQVNIVGNTACWSRLPMVMASKSVLVNCTAEAPDDVMWYYPLMREGEHYVGADSSRGDDLLRAHEYCVNNDAECRARTVRANSLARSLFHSGTAASYTAMLLETAAT